MKRLIIGLLFLTASISAFSSTHCYSSNTYNGITGAKITSSEIKLANGYITDLNITGHKLIKSPVETIENNDVISFKLERSLTSAVSGGPYNDGELHHNKIKLNGDLRSMTVWLSECLND